MAATWVLFMTSPAGAALGPHLARHGLDYCHTAHPTAVLRPMAGAGADHGSGEECRGFQRAGAGRRRRRHARDVGGIEADAPFLFALLGGQSVVLADGETAVGAGAQAGPAGLAAWIGVALPRRGAGWRRPINRPSCRRCWAPWVLHCGLTPESTYSGQMGKVIAFALEAAGAPIDQGRLGGGGAAFRA
jgi:phytoene dehydrogenase-like protein